MLQYWLFCSTMRVQAAVLKCPANLVYDLDRQQCLYRSQVYGCTGVEPTTTAPANDAQQEGHDAVEEFNRRLEYYFNFTYI